MRARGMHDIPTVQSMASRSIPATRAKIVTQLARAEQERERLDREMDVWVGKQKQAEERLRQVGQRIKLLERALSWASEEHPESGPQRRDDETRQTNDDGQETKSWREIPLEY